VYNIRQVMRLITREAPEKSAASAADLVKGAERGAVRCLKTSGSGSFAVYIKRDGNSNGTLAV